MATVEWFEEDSPGSYSFHDEEPEDLYCPYTNGPKCPVMEKGWQVQELCRALECEQLKYLHHVKRRRRKAA